MRKFKTAKRLSKIENVIKARQFSLRVVLENIHDPHNVSAIFRTCDAVGVAQVDLLYYIEEFPKISRVSSASSKKWVKKNKFTNVDECIENLRSEGYKIYGTLLSEKAENIYNIDFTDKVAIVLGNEHRGISDEMKEKADKHIYIPMRGMIQSLNVSVAAAVTLYEAQRQRAIKGMYEKSQLDPMKLEEMIDEWCGR